MVWVRRAVVTPSRVVALGCEPHGSNRVLRVFSQYSERFLRVTFCDEGGQWLPVNTGLGEDTYDRCGFDSHELWSVMHMMPIRCRLPCVDIMFIIISTCVIRHTLVGTPTRSQTLQSNYTVTLLCCINAGVMHRMRTALCDGIHLAGLHYELLAYSNSQLRGCSCWMFAAAPDSTTESSIRAWMGDFREIRSAARYGARMGQCFSSTVVVLELQVGACLMWLAAECGDGVLFVGLV